MSYIEKEKLIKADIASIENKVRHAFNQGYDLGYKDGKKRAKPQEQEPRWISVSERLPKAGEYVGNVAKYYLVQNEYGDMLVARYTHSEYWEQMYQLKPISDEVVAWRELPKQYKVESEDKE